MIDKNKFFFSLLVTASILMLALPIQAKSKKSSARMFGPTGMLGTLKGKSILVSEAQKGSPAEGILKKGSEVIGVGKKKFSNPIYDLSTAIDVAEGKEANGKLTLMLKGGKTAEIILPVLGDYSKTAPFDCPKTDRIISMTAERLVKSLDSKNAGGRLKVDLLALMATGEKKYIDAVAKVIKNSPWAKLDGKPQKNHLFCTWNWGYWATTLAEYYLLTGDKSVLPSIKSYAISIAGGQDSRGVWGHQLADPNNFMRIPGYGPMNQPTLTCFMGMLMAKKVGIEDPVLEKGIEKTNQHVQRHAGKGSFPYGMGGPYSGGFNNNGTSGSATICLELIGDSSGAGFFSKCAATSYAGLEQGHASAFFNPVWTSLGAVRSGPEVSSQHFKRTLWFYNLRRGFDGSWSPDDKPGSMDGVALLNYCVGRRALIITGREMDESLWVKGKEANEVIGLSTFNLKGRTSKELISLATEHLMPQIRRKAGGAMGEHRKELTPSYIKWLKSGTTEQKMLAIGQYGWWIKLEEKLPQLPAIAAILTDPKETEELRKAAANSVVHMGDGAKKYYMDILKLLDSSGDQSLGKALTTLSRNPFKEGLVKDKEVLYRVALELAGHKEQGQRGQGMHMLVGMPLEDFHLVVDKIKYILEGTDPNWTSYSAPQNDIAPAIMVLASLNIKEGLDYALQIFELRPKAKHMFRYRATWISLGAYGANAKEALKRYNVQHKNRTEYGRGTGAYKAMLKQIEDDKSPSKMISLAEAIAAGKK